jgi:hypothetical protein
VAGVPLGAWIGDTQEDAHLRVRVAEAGRPPLVARQHHLVAVEAGGRAEVRGVGGGDVGLGHQEHRADLAGEQRVEPAALLLGRPVLDQDLHVPGVGRVAVEDLGRQERAPHLLGDGRVLDVGEPRAALALGQEQVPQPLGARQRLERGDLGIHGPGPPVGARPLAPAALGEPLLEGQDVGGDEGSDPLAQLG